MYTSSLGIKSLLQLAMGQCGCIVGGVGLLYCLVVDTTGQIVTSFLCMFSMSGYIPIALFLLLLALVIQLSL